jgi:hypothetical protein
MKKGYKPTKKHLKRLSESHIGQIPWNKGMKMNDEFKEKCRKRAIGVKQTLGQIEKRASQMRGSNHPRWISNRTKLQKYGDDNKDRRSTAYNYWRKQIKECDNCKCKINNQDCKGRLEVHHILGYTEHPELRYDINNGITLCHFHHPKMREEEKRLISTFKELVSVSKELL